MYKSPCAAVKLFWFNYKLINNTHIGTYIWKGEDKEKQRKQFFKISAFDIVKIHQK